MDNELLTPLDPQNNISESEALFDLSLDDDTLYKLTTSQLDRDISHWEKAPWLLTQTDKENIEYILGIQQDSKVPNPQTQTPYVDNRLFTAVRSMLAYATGQTAKPELLPSKLDDTAKYIARQTGAGLYQHALDHEVNQEMRLALKNVITRKRGYLKLRYDEDYGPFGDVCTENIDPSDIVVARFARYQRNPERIYHKQIASIQDLCEQFPDKKQDILDLYDIKRGVFTQMSKVVTYWECWFTYYDADGKEAEGVCWFIPNSRLILGKMQNPNWLYNGSKKEQLIANMTYCPIKPFIILNYWNTGRSFIDETCLFDQARPQQDILNKRGRQIVENADFAVPRILVNGSLMDEADARKFVNKSPRTIGVLNKMTVDANINNAVHVIPPVSLPSYVMQDKYDARAEIDNIMGTPSQFRGAQSQTTTPTLGQDLMIKNQSSALQDDLVQVTQRAWRQYYTYLLQMMNVYLPDDYYVMAQGSDGEYSHIKLSSSSLDTNVRVTIRVDSTLPLDKEAQRATAIQLAQMQKIDPLTLYESLGWPEPEKAVERLLRFNLDPITYIQSVSQQIMSREAETDIQLLISGKAIEERSDYNEDYLNHFNLFITRNEFRMLPQDAQQRITAHLDEVANKASITEGLKSSMLDPSGILDQPLNPPMPVRQVRLVGQLDPAQTAAMTGMPNYGGGSGGSPPAPQGQPSPPRMQNPSQFGVK